MSPDPWFRIVIAAALFALGWWWGAMVGFSGTRHALIGILFFAPAIGWVLAPLLMDAFRRHALARRARAGRRREDRRGDRPRY